MALAGAFAMSTPAAAAPISPAVPSAVPAMAGQVELAQYRGHWRRGWDGRRHWRDGRHHHRYWGHRRGDRRWYGYGPSVAGAIASAIIGGSIVASQRDYGDEWQRCDDRYRSFRWSDGTFQPYGDGPRQLCPYLAR
jgi:hypothetical protein